MCAVNTSVTWGIPSGAPWWCRVWRHPQWEEHVLCAIRGTCVKCTDCVQWEGHFLQYKFAIAGSSLNMLCFNLQLIYSCMFRNLFCCRILCLPIIQLPNPKWRCDCVRSCDLADTDTASMCGCHSPCLLYGMHWKSYVDLLKLVISTYLYMSCDYFF